MPQKFNTSEFNRRVRAAQRQVEQDYNRQVRKINTDLQRQVAQYNREVDAHNKRAVADHNRRAEAHNRRVVADFNRRLQQARPTSRVTYTIEEERLATRVQESLLAQGVDHVDLFLSYARIDGLDVARELRCALVDLGVDVWFDELAIRPGRSQALQMDKGLRAAEAGVALLTPAYLAGRFWTERELGALLHKPTLIPVLHKVTFEDVKQYSGILPDLAGFETARDSVADIAEKIAAAVLIDYVA